MDDVDLYVPAEKKVNALLEDLLSMRAFVAATPARQDAYFEFTAQVEAALEHAQDLQRQLLAMHGEVEVEVEAEDAAVSAGAAVEDANAEVAVDDEVEVEEVEVEIAINKDELMTKIVMHIMEGYANNIMGANNFREEHKLFEETSETLYVVETSRLGEGDEWRDMLWCVRRLDNDSFCSAKYHGQEHTRRSVCDFLLPPPRQCQGIHLRTRCTYTSGHLGNCSFDAELVGKRKRTK